MNRLLKWLTRRLSTKLIIMMLILLISSISFTSYFYYRDATLLIAEHVRETTSNSASQMSTYVDMIAIIGTNMGKQISRDVSLQSNIQGEHRLLTVDERYEQKESVDQMLNHLVYTNSFISSIYIINEEGESWGSGQFNTSKVRRYTLNQHEWYTSIMNNEQDERWLPLQLDPFSGGGADSELVFTYIKALKNIQTKQTVGIIVINMDGKVITDLFANMKLGESGKFFIINGNKELLLYKERAPWMEGLLEHEQWISSKQIHQRAFEFELDMEDTRYFIVTQPLMNDWIVVGAVPVHEITDDIQQTQLKIWRYVIILLAIAVAMTLLFSRKITDPLKQLMAQMEQVEGSNFNASIEVKSRDEIGLLSLKFNKMVKQIDSLIAELGIEQASKREAEIRALRHQIQPHFLYNTLSTLRWMVTFKKYDQVYHGISALVQVMEASMEKRGPMLTIAEELDLLQKYMVIQRLRYGEHLQLHVSCETKLREVQVPRMLLQPIVENAIFHGISPKETGGTINIRVFEENRSIVMIVADDGVGMERQVSEALLMQDERDNKGLFGIGLKHVHDTLQLYYGPLSGVHIESTINEGTTITLKLILKGVNTHVL